MKTVLLLMGLTGSGKTTMARKFAQDLGFHHFHCIQPLKTHLEEIFELPKGSLTSQQGKKLTLPDSENVTFQQLLVDLFEFWNEREHGRGIYGAQSTKIQILNSPNNSIVIDSIRNPLEVKMLKSLVEAGEIEVDLIQLENLRAKREVSDRYLWSNTDIIETFCRFHLVFENIAPLEESYTRLKKMYCELLADD